MTQDLAHEPFIDTQVTTPDRMAWTLTDAVLWYRNAAQQSSLVMTAPVTTDATGRPQLGAPRALSARRLSTLLRQAGANVAHGEFLPSHVLYRQPGLIVWWTPPQVRRLAYADGQGVFSQLHGHAVHVPACVWRLQQGTDLAVRAVAGDARPTPDTRLAVAPFWNVYPDGRVCLGSMRAPRRDAVDVIDAWVEGFFGSVFSHPNANRAELTQHPDGFFGAWAAARATPFAEAWLVPTATTLSAFASPSARTRP